MWLRYAEVIPADASAIQRRETERTFYAALLSMADFMYVLGDKDVSEEESAAQLETFLTEVNQRVIRFIVEDVGGSAQ
jgi:hypothetical protein